MKERKKYSGGAEGEGETKRGREGACQEMQGEGNGVADVPLTSADGPARDISTCYIAETNLPTDVGQFRLRAYRIADDEFTSDKANRFVGTEPCVIYAANRPPFGSTDGTTKSVPIRIHDQCFTSEVFRSQR